MNAVKTLKNVGEAMERWVRRSSAFIGGFKAFLSNTEA
jgi:hypothetical protein